MAEWKGRVGIGPAVEALVEIDNPDAKNWAARRLDDARQVPADPEPTDPTFSVVMLDGARKDQAANARPANDEEAASGIWLVGDGAFT